MLVLCQGPQLLPSVRRLSGGCLHKAGVYLLVACTARASQVIPSSNDGIASKPTIREHAHKTMTNIASAVLGVMYMLLMYMLLLFCCSHDTSKILLLDWKSFAMVVPYDSSRKFGGTTVECQNADLPSDARWLPSRPRRMP